MQVFRRSTGQSCARQFTLQTNSASHFTRRTGLYIHTSRDSPSHELAIMLPQIPPIPSGADRFREPPRCKASEAGRRS